MTNLVPSRNILIKEKLFRSHLINIWAMRLKLIEIIKFEIEGRIGERIGLACAAFGKLEHIFKFEISMLQDIYELSEY